MFATGEENVPSRREHLARDRELFEGREYPDVHRLLDQFAHFPDMRFLSRHRKFLHHEEGIEYVRMRFGEEAGESARQHVLMDCEHVPKAVDYYIDLVDEYGYRRTR